MDDTTFLADVEKHREARDRRLRSKDGWLSLVARTVLEEGDNAIDIGVATLRDGDITLSLASDVQGTVDGASVRTHTWAASEPGPGPYLFVGERRYELLRQGKRCAVRVRDPHSAALASYPGLEFFAPDKRFCVDARLVPANPPRKISLATGIGGDVDNTCPGTLVFTIDGKELTLDPVIEDDAPTRLFLIFRDATNRANTYGGGRFLYTPLPDDNGHVVVDFNKSYNPPCALTEFAACPVAPPQNHIAIAIEAGEKRYGSH